MLTAWGDENEAKNTHKDTQYDRIIFENRLNHYLKLGRTRWEALYLFSFNVDCIILQEGVGSQDIARSR